MGFFSWGKKFFVGANAAANAGEAFHKFSETKLGKAFVGRTKIRSFGIGRGDEKGYTRCKDGLARKIGDSDRTEAPWNMTAQEVFLKLGKFEENLLSSTWSFGEFKILVADLQVDWETGIVIIHHEATDEDCEEDNRRIDHDIENNPAENILFRILEENDFEKQCQAVGYSTLKKEFLQSDNIKEVSNLMKYTGIAFSAISLAVMILAFLPWIYFFTGATGVVSTLFSLAVFEGIVVIFLEKDRDVMSSKKHNGMFWDFGQPLIFVLIVNATLASFLALLIWGASNVYFASLIFELAFLLGLTLLRIPFFLSKKVMAVLLVSVLVVAFIFPIVGEEKIKSLKKRLDTRKTLSSHSDYKADLEQRRYTIEKCRVYYLPDHPQRKKGFSGRIINAKQTVLFVRNHEQKDAEEAFVVVMLPNKYGEFAGGEIVVVALKNATPIVTPKKAKVSGAAKTFLGRGKQFKLTSDQVKAQNLASLKSLDHVKLYIPKYKQGDVVEFGENFIVNTASQGPYETRLYINNGLFKAFKGNYVPKGTRFRVPRPVSASPYNKLEIAVLTTGGPITDRSQLVLQKVN